MNTFKKIKNTIKWYFSEEYRIWHHPIYIRLCFHKLYKDWFKCRKIFIKPKLKLYKGDSIEHEYLYYMYDYANYFKNKLFGFHIEGLGWKTKFGIYEYTHCPEIVCVINKKVRFTIRLEYPIDNNFNPHEKEIANHRYWDAIINYLYDNQPTLFKVNDNYYLGEIDLNTNKPKSYYYIDNCLIPALKDKAIYLTPQMKD